MRELSLIGAGGSLPAPLADLVESVVHEFAPARDAIKRQALAAAGRGEPMTDLRLRLPLSAADAGERYLAALDEADRYARSEQLLTLEAPETHRQFRRWYVTALITQLRAVAAGQPPVPARPFQASATETGAERSLREPWNL